MTVHAKTYHKSANIFIEIRADFAFPIFNLLSLYFVLIARSVAEIRLFLYGNDGYIAFTKWQFLPANYVARNVSVYASVY